MSSQSTQGVCALHPLLTPVSLHQVRSQITRSLTCKSQNNRYNYLVFKISSGKNCKRTVPVGVLFAGRTLHRGGETLLKREFAFMVFRGFEPPAFPNPDNLEPPIGGLSNNAGVVVLPTRPLRYPDGLEHNIYTKPTHHKSKGVLPSSKISFPPSFNPSTQTWFFFYS